LLSPFRRSALFAAPALAAVALAACSKQQAEQYRTDLVGRGAITEVVSATGGVEAITTVNVGSQVSGTILELYVDFNSLVKKNQVLAQIDPRLFRAADERAAAGLASAKANVEKAEAALADARRQEARAKELFDSKLTSRADVDTALANREQAAAALSVAKAGVLQAKADRDTAAANLAYTKITSPIDGIVVSRAVDKGQTVAASFQTPTLFTIANDLTKMQILANIDEADVGKVREQMEAKFTVDAWPGEAFTGRIREVRQAPTTISNVVTYAAVIDAPNPERKLRQGMTASVQITTGRREEVVRVPNAALRFKPSAAALASSAAEKGKGAGNGAGNGSGSGAGNGAVNGTVNGASNGPGNGKVYGAGNGASNGSDNGSGNGAGNGGAGAATSTAGGPVAPAGGLPGTRDGKWGERGGMRAEGKRDPGAREAGRDGAAGSEPFQRKVSRMGKIYKLVDGKPVGVPVRLGLGDSQNTEVLEGLAEGEVVVVGEAGATQQRSGNVMGPPGPPPGGGGMRRGF
jgi:HlyD family secretion protein